MKKKYKLKKNVKMFFYKFGIAAVCLFMMLNLTDLSRLEGIFAADSNIDFQSLLVKDVNNDTSGSESIEVQSGETFYIRGKYSINSLGGGEENTYTAGTYSIKLPENAVLDDAVTRELLETHPSIFNDFTYLETNRMLSFHTNGDFKSGVGGSVYIALRYKNMMTENDFKGIFNNIQFTASTTGGQITPIQMNNLTVVNKASQEWNISKTIEPQNGQDYSYNKEKNVYSLKYKLQVNPDGNADRYGRLECTKFELTDTLPTLYSGILDNKTAQGYPEGGGAKSIRIIANENEGSERELTEGTDYTLEKADDGSIAKIHILSSAMNTSAGNMIDAGTMVGTTFQVYADYAYDAYEIPINEKEIDEYFLNNKLTLSYQPLKQEERTVEASAGTALGWKDENAGKFSLPIQKQVKLGTDSLLSGSITEIRDFDEDLQKAFLKDGDAITFSLYKDKNTSVYAKDADGDTVEPISITNKANVEKGIVTFENLLAGTYYLKETMNFDGFDTPAIKKIVIAKDGMVSVDGKNVNKDESVKFVNSSDENGFGYVAFWKKGSTAVSANAENYLSGITFKLTSKDNKKTYTAVSDDTGLVLFQGVLAGEYTLEEVDRGDGEFASPSNDWKVTVVGNQVNYPLKANNDALDKDDAQKPYIKNTSTKGGLKIVKQDKEENKKLSGAEFTAYGPFSTEEEANNADITGSNGIHISSSFTDGSTYFALSEGWYAFKETKAPEGYAISNEKITAEIKKNQINTLTVINEKFFQLDVTKTGRLSEGAAGASIPLGGAEFTVYTDEGCTQIAKDYTNPQQPKNAVITTYISGGKSKSNTVSLRKDATYWIKETKTPQGYQKKNTAEKLEQISEDKKYSYTYPAVNIASSLGQIKIEKRDASNHDKKLEGIEFEIYDNKGNKVDTVVTDQNGIAESVFLNDGDYQIKEITQPVGYSKKSKDRIFKAINTDKIALTEGAGIKVEENKVTEVIIENEPLVTFKIKKQDDKNQLLAGVSFKLYPTQEDANQDTNGKTYTTDSNGEITFQDLEPQQTYYYRETKTASDAFILNEEIRSFTAPGKDSGYVQNEPAPVIENVKYGYFKITKKLQNFNASTMNGPLSGIEFQYFPKTGADSTMEADLAIALGHNTLRSAVTGDDGTFTSEKLQPGDYWLVETTDEKYAPMPPQVITVTSGETYEQEVVNTTSYGKLSVKKVSSLKPNNQEIVITGGARFEVYDYISEDYHAYDGKTPVDAFNITEKNGVHTTKFLAPGTYAVREVKPTGTNMQYYTPDLTSVYRIEVKSNELNAELKTNPVKNTPKGRFYLKKEEVWMNNIKFNQVMEFGIYKDEACTQLVVKMNSETKGETLSPHLDAGEYYVKEILSDKQKENYGEPVAKKVMVIAGQNHANTAYKNIINSDVGGTKKNPLSFENHPQKSKILIEKVDRDNPELRLNDARFSVFQDVPEGTPGIQETVVIDGQTHYFKKISTVNSITGSADINTEGNGDKGYAFTEYLEPGENYYLREWKAPSGYNREQEWIGPISLKNGELKEIQVKNFKPTEAAGEKVDQKKQLIKEKGIQIALLEDKTKAENLQRLLINDQEAVLKKLADQKNWSEYGISQIAETDENGQFTFKNLNTMSMYYVVEVKTLDNYVRDQAVHTVTVKEDNGSYKLFEDDKAFQLINAQRGQIQVKKIVKLSGTEIPLDGVGFEIYKAKDQSTDSDDKETEGQPLKYVTGTFQSGVNGAFLSEYLDAGWYIVKETTVPEGIVKPDDSKVWRVQVKEGEVNKDLFDNPILNIAAYGKFYLKKVKDENPASLLNATFRLERYDEKTNTYKTHTETITFDKTQNVYESDFLPAGSYQLIETSVEDGYTVDSTPVPFEIIANKITGMDTNGKIQALDAYADNPIQIKNKEKGSLHIRKVGTLYEGDTPVELNGITFQLYHNRTDDALQDISDENFVAEAVSSSGYITMDDLDAGSYWLKETEVNEANKNLGYTAGKTVKITIEPGRETTKTADGVDFTNESTYGRFKITKVDEYSKAVLQGAVFAVFDNEACTGIPVDTITTGADGTSYTKMLPVKEYWLKEIVSPVGYLPSDQVYGPYAVEKHKQSNPGKISNKPAQSIRIQKTDKDTNAVIDADYMKSAEFAIYKTEEDAKSNQNAIQTVKGNEDLLFTNLLPDTRYWIHEITPPNGYTKLSAPVSVTTKTGTKEGSVLIQEIENSAQGSILIQKVAQWDIDTANTKELPLAKVVFTLTKDDDSDFKMKAQTNKEGFAEFRGLDAGSYTLTETVPEGFKADSPYTWNIDVETGKQNTTYTGDNAIINKPVQGKFQFQKTTIDSAMIQNVQDAVFALEKKNNDTWEPVSGYESFHTDDDKGRFDSGMLVAGSYRLVEKQAPDGYAVMSPIAFEIKSSQITTVVTKDKTTVENEALGNVKIKKYSDSYLYDESGAKKPLRGVSFTLSNDGDFEQTEVTDENGVCEWKDLDPGTYTLTETNVPGYETLKPMTVIVESKQREVKTYYPEHTNEGELFNTSVKGKLVIHKTDMDGNALQGAEFQIYKPGESNPLTTKPLVTDENGYAVSDLLDAAPNGTTYIVKETKAPDGYTLDEDLHAIEKKAVVKPLQLTDIILQNQSEDKTATNFVSFVNERKNYFEDFNISVEKEIQQADGSFAKDEIPETETKHLLGNDQDAVFRINGYAEGKNKIDAESVTVTDKDLFLYYMNNGKFVKETAASYDYTLNSITVYPAYSGNKQEDSDPVHAVLEYQTFGKDEWKAYTGADALKNLQKADAKGITLDIAALDAVHFRLRYTGTKKEFHADGIEFSVTFKDREHIAAQNVHEIRKATNQAEAAYLYNIKDEHGSLKAMSDVKQSNEAAIYFPLQQTIAPKANLSIKTDNGSTFAPGEIVYYTITAENRSGGANPPDLAYPIISFDLPEGTTFVNDYKNMGRSLLLLYGAEDDATIIEPEDMEVNIKENVPLKEVNHAGELVETDKTTTKVTIKLKNLSIDTANKLYVKFAAQISQSPSSTGLLAPSYLTSGATLPLSAENPYGNSVVFDVSSGGDVVADPTLDEVLENKDIGGEKFAYSGVDVRVKVSNNLNVYKEVKGQYDKTYLNTANTGLSGPGGSISYNIILQNGVSDQKIRKARVVDILPFQGDTMVARTNTAGNVTQRNTELDKRPVLNSVTVTNIDGSEVTQPYTIYYCVSDGVGEDLTAEWTKNERENYTREVELPMLYDDWSNDVWKPGAHKWQTAVSEQELQRVTAIAVEFDAEQKPLGQYEGFNVHVEMTAPMYSTDKLQSIQDKLIKNSAMGAVLRFGKDENSIDLSDTVENDPVKVKLTLAKGSIGDYAFFDRNKDGIQDDEDIPVTGLNVTLHTYKTYKNEKGKTVKEELPQKHTATDQTGYYLFDHLDCNQLKDGKAESDNPDDYVGNVIYSYQVEFATPKDESQYAYEPTIRFAGSDKEKDSNIEQKEIDRKLVNISDEVRLKTVRNPDGSINGEDNMTIDAGFKALGAVGDTVWIDKNRNGIQDIDEPGVSDVVVRLYRVDEDGKTGKAMMETKTDHNGKYLFDKLKEGKYVVEFDVSNTDSYGYTPYAYTTPYVEGNPASEIDSNAREYNGSKTIARSDVFELGDHAVDLSIDAGLTYYSALSGYCFEDRNYNHIQDINIPLPNTIVELYRMDESGKRESKPLRTTTVGKDGTYFFDHLNEGYYQVRFIYPDGFEAVEPHQGNDEIDSDVSDELDEIRHFGYTPVLYIAPNSLEEHWDAGAVRYGSIGDFVWQDLNKNGIQDAGEPPVSNVPVYLQTRQKGEATWNFYAATETNEHGRYVFERLQGSEYTGMEYRVVFDLPYDTKLTTPMAGTDIKLDSNALAVYMNGWGFPTNAIRLGYGQHDMTWDAGIIQTSGSVGDYVWFDTNKNGIQDEENTGISDIRVILERNDSGDLSDADWKFISETRTNHAGYYRFDDLQAGYYRVRFYLKGYTITMPLSGSDSALDSDGYDKKGYWYTSRPFYLEDGGFDMTWDCGVYKGGKGNTVFINPAISQTVNGPVNTADTTSGKTPTIAVLSLAVLLILGRKLHKLKKEA